MAKTKEQAMDVVLKKESTKLSTQVSSFKITSPKDMEKGTELLSTLNDNLKKIKTEKEKITVPLKQALDAEKARWEVMETEMKNAVAMIRNAMSEYQTEQQRIADEEADKIAARVGQGKGKLKLDTATAKIAQIEKPEQKVTTTAGSIKFRPHQKLKVTDENLIPRKYMVINESLLLADLKSGKTIPGAELETIQIPVNRTA